MSSIAFITLSVTLTKREADIFKVIMARYDTILDQSERENLHHRLSNSTKAFTLFYLQWIKLGANISNFPFSLGAIVFHLGLGGKFKLSTAM